MDKRKRCMDTRQALLLLNELTDGESDGGEISGLSEASLGGSSPDASSSESDPEPLREVRPLVSDFPTDRVVLGLNEEDGPVDPPVTGRDGTEWTYVASSGGTGRQGTQNILTESSGPTAYAKRNIENKYTSFLCMCDEDMLQHIRECTVAEARRGNEERASWDLPLAELKAFIALLYVRGAFCANNIDMESFWSEHWGNTFFIQTMSRNRFRDILRYLRFDHKETRPGRLTETKFALVSEIWEKFTSNCISAYKPGPEITVDEQLFPTKARCRFTQFMPNKPDKFGIKFWLAADVETKYLLNSIPYLGKDGGRPAELSVGESVVLKLVEPFVGKGRNVTTDNFFTSVPLAKTLLAKKTSLVGTIKRNKRGLPPCVNGRGELFETKVLKHGKITLSVYQCKPRRNVTILSTQHQHVSISTDTKKKPETVLYYNRTKVGVDVLDQMARQYSTKAGTRRWPVAVFYNMLDLAGINACVLYRSCMNDNIPRREFILQLAHELRAEWMASKEPPRISVTPREEEEARRMTCTVKQKCKQNKTSVKCVECRKAVCGKCTAKVQHVCCKCV